MSAINMIAAMIATIWTKKDCSDCEYEKAVRKAEGYELDERDAEEIKALGDDDLLAAYQMQDERLPVVRINGVFVTPRSHMRKECPACNAINRKS